MHHLLHMKVVYLQIFTGYQGKHALSTTHAAKTHTGGKKRHLCASISRKSS